MGQQIHRVAIIGCGRLGQHYAEAYTAYPDTEVVAIAEYNEERRKVVGERFSVSALYPDAHALLRDVVPDVAAVVTPTRYMKEAVIACAEAGVKGVSTDKPIAGVLSDADEMVEACREQGVVFSGGNLQRAMNEVQEAAHRIRAGEYGELIGSSVHAWGGQISGGGCQHISVLRLLTGAEVDELVAWGSPYPVMENDNDAGLNINGLFHMSNALECAVFGTESQSRGVDVWSREALIRWNWAPPEIYRGFSENGARVRIDPGYKPYQWSEFYYLTGSIRSFLAAVTTGSELAVSGHDLRQALEVAIAAKQSALLGNVPVKLPLADRSLALYPIPHRWLGYDAVRRPQPLAEAAGLQKR